LVHRNRNCGELVSGQNLNGSADRSFGKNHPYLSFLKIMFQALICTFEGIRSLLAQIAGKLNSSVFLLVISTSTIRLRVLLDHLCPEFLFIGSVGLLLVCKHGFHISLSKCLCGILCQLFIKSWHSKVTRFVCRNGLLGLKL